MKNSHIYRIINFKHKDIHGDSGYISDDTKYVFINITNIFLAYTMNKNDSTTVVALKKDERIKITSLDDSLKKMIHKPVKIEYFQG